MNLAVIRDIEYLKSIGLKKTILVVKKDNQIIKVASFDNEEMLDLFIKAFDEYGFKFQ